MRFLVVGAGAIGGYFGGRLLEAGRDVTFLVRPGRAEQLAATGLAIRSPRGNADLPAPTVLADRLHDAFDVVLLSCKAYDLDAAMDALAPAVGAGTAILPLLNGMRHLDTLDARFGADRVLGGACLISATLDAEGRIIHLNDSDGLVFGERGGGRSARVEAIAAAFAGARFDGRLSEAILQEMWEKWVFIATLAGITTLMRATLGDVVASGGAALAASLLDECAAVAARQGFAPRADWMAGTRRFFGAPGAFVAASMLRDIERGARPEADQILGDLLRRAGAEPERDAPLLRLAVAHAKAYEARREREQTQRGAPVSGGYTG
ncbi:MAG: 2-dehydropantoate 2-reductase [Acetobacteraceae bacterium]|nr:2-dehydropantoate 2-reductase [Acetobacteraceae bacterium]